MNKIIETTHLARKDYECHACKAFTTWGDIDDYELTDEENIIFKMARADDFKIKKGQKYVRQVFDSGDQLITYRAIPEIHQIAIKYKMFD